MKYAIALAVFAVNLLNVPALLYAVGAGWVPWWCGTIAFALWTWLMLPGTTWRDYAAGSNVDRVKHGCNVTLPAQELRMLKPDHERLIDWQLALPASARNFVFNATWGWLYFLDPPREVGFTRRLNRYRAGPDVEQAATADQVSARWLDPLDRRGRHT